MKSAPSSPNRNASPGAADPLHADEPRAWLSALADGDADAVQRGCVLWRDDEDARRAWHTYHLIGDVMRSEELATRPARDAAFLAAVRVRLAAEPVVLAPAEAAASTPTARRRQPWLVPAAAAAGFAVVAGVLVITRIGMPGLDNAPGLADVGSPGLAAGSGTQLVSNPARGALPQRNGGGTQVYIRDARVDEFLRVHQATRIGVAVAAPGGSLQAMDTAAPTPVVTPAATASAIPAATR